MIKLGSGLNPQLQPTGSDLLIDPNLLLDNTLIIGANGAGKTTLGLNLIDQVLDLGHPVLVLDTTGDLTSALMEGRSSRLHRGFFDDPDPTDPRIQLNSIDISAAAGMFARPLHSSAGEQLWVEEAHSLVAALLDVLGFRVRGLSPEFVLVENIVVAEWNAGRDVALDRLASLAESPPFRTLGVFDVDKVISHDRRADLAAAILSLLNAPGFTSNPPMIAIDLEALITRPDGGAAANVISFAQRSLEVRRFLASVVFAKLATFVEHKWHEDQFSMMVYIDEGVTFLPTAPAVSTTTPLLEMIANWRQFGVGTALVAEQPDDLHQSALDFCETWIAGSMPVARSRQAVVQELDLVNPPIDEVALDACLKRMSAGQFVLRSPRLETLQYFQTPIN